MKIRDYYWFGKKVFVVDHIAKFVSVPQSVDEKDYPEEVNKALMEGYYKQLNIE